MIEVSDSQVSGRQIMAKNVDFDLIVLSSQRRMAMLLNL